MKAISTHAVAAMALLMASVQLSAQQGTPPPAPQAPTAFWYYCSSAKGYYPTVPSCPEEWVKVPERTR